jgi:hypothetical protein
MASWFDSLAKKSSQRAAGMESGAQRRLSRRQVIVGGSAAMAAAWTAPVLMASSAAALGLSACPPPSSIKTCNDNAQICCPNATDTCQVVNSNHVCIVENTSGGTCSNQGQGVCSDGTKCNSNKNSKGCNLCRQPNICGGEGSPCGTDADCFGSPTQSTCTSTGAQTAGKTFCRRKCTAPGGCNTGQVCDTSGFCAVPCTNDQQCQNGNGTCQSNFCTYAD